MFKCHQPCSVTWSIEFPSVFEACAPAVDGVTVEAKVPYLWAVCGLRRPNVSTPSSPVAGVFFLPIPPQHEFSLFGKFGLDGLVELGGVPGAGEVPFRRHGM